MSVSAGVHLIYQPALSVGAHIGPMHPQDVPGAVFLSVLMLLRPKYHQLSLHLAPEKMNRLDFERVADLSK